MQAIEADDWPGDRSMSEPLEDYDSVYGSDIRLCPSSPFGYGRFGETTSSGVGTCHCFQSAGVCECHDRTEFDIQEKQSLIYGRCSLCAASGSIEPGVPCLLCAYPDVPFGSPGSLASNSTHDGDGGSPDTQSSAEGSWLGSLPDEGNGASQGPYTDATEDSNPDFMIENTASTYWPGSHCTTGKTRRESPRKRLADAQSRKTPTISDDQNWQADRIVIERALPSKYERLSKRKRSEDRGKFKCDREECSYNEPFYRNWELQRHIKTVHRESTVQFVCEACGTTKLRKDKLKDECEKKHEWSEDMIKAETRNVRRTVVYQL